MNWTDEMIDFVFAQRKNGKKYREIVEGWPNDERPTEADLRNLVWRATRQQKRAEVHPLTPTRILHNNAEEIRKTLAIGGSVADIARKYGIEYSTTYTWLWRRGMLGDCKHHWTQEDCEYIERLDNMGINLAGIYHIWKLERKQTPPTRKAIRSRLYAMRREKNGKKEQPNNFKK